MRPVQFPGHLRQLNSRQPTCELFANSPTLFQLNSPRSSLAALPVFLIAKLGVAAGSSRTDPCILGRWFDRHLPSPTDDSKFDATALLISDLSHQLFGLFSHKASMAVAWFHSRGSFEQSENTDTHVRIGNGMAKVLGKVPYRI